MTARQPSSSTTAMGESGSQMSAAVLPSSRRQIPSVSYQALSPTSVSSQSQILPSMDISGTRPRVIGSSTPSFLPRDLPLPWGPPAVQLSNRTAGKPISGAGDAGRDGGEGGDRQRGGDGEGEPGGDEGCTTMYRSVRAELYARTSLSTVCPYRTSSSLSIRILP